jgi:hypothetical protein
MQLKKLNKSAMIYHHFELSPTEFALYDDELDMPVAYGSKNLVDVLLRNLNKSVIIIYYKRDVDKISYKRKMKYDGEKRKMG